MQTYNINTQARVILTSAGAEILSKYSNTPYSKGESHKSELWHIMHVFGPYLRMGVEIPYENNNIEIL